jgi:hypothetical protein
MGELGADGSVAWFEVIDTTTIDGRLLADLGDVAEINVPGRTVTTLDGFEFLLETTETDCGLGPAEVDGVQALADWTTGAVVALICLYDI